jgi:hypothetical protein
MKTLQSELKRLMKECLCLIKNNNKKESNSWSNSIYENNEERFLFI